MPNDLQAQINEASELPEYYDKHTTDIEVVPTHITEEWIKQAKRQAFIDGVNFANHSDRSNHAVHVNQKAAQYAESI